MNIGDEFWAAVSAAERDPAMTGPHLLGSRLALAATQVLGAQAAGLSVSSRDLLVRVPLGASNLDAGAAERLQFTAGEGPCLDAHALSEPIMASAAVIDRAWPIFARQLQAHTPFRSVFAVPLPGIGALDVYFTDPAGSGTVDVVVASFVAQQIQVALAHTDLPAVLADPTVTSAQRRRAQVPIAMGMIMVTLALSPAEALAVLRARAFTAERTVEELAHDVVSGAIDAEQLIA